MSHDAGAVCLCQADHRPTPLELESHHVWPIGIGGPNVPANRVWVCPTTHTNTHEILRLMMRDGHMTWTDVLDLYDVPVSRYAYTLASQGYGRWLTGWTAP